MTLEMHQDLLASSPRPRFYSLKTAFKTFLVRLALITCEARLESSVVLYVFLQTTKKEGDAIPAKKDRVMRKLG